MNYSTFVEASYLRYDSPDRIGGYEISDRGDRFAVYTNGRQFIYAIRGTIPTIPRDLYLDTLVYINKLHESKEFAQLYQIAVNLYNTGLPVYLCGHSLGASFCLDIMEANPNIITECHLYNTGFGMKKFIYNTKLRLRCSSLNLFKSSETKEECEKFDLIKSKTYIHTSGIDPISILSRFSGFTNTSHVPSGNILTSHSLNNFAPKLGGRLLVRF